jgi:hypothetical protein
VLTAAELQRRGDATAEQRAELRTLLEQKAVPAAWVGQLYADVRAAGGLSKAAALSHLAHLRGLADKGVQPTYVTKTQADELRVLMRTRMVPGKLVTKWKALIGDGTLTYVAAELALRECRKFPLRPYLPPTVPATANGFAPDGYFALVTGDEQVRFFRIHTLHAEGRRAVEQIVRQNPDRRRRIPTWEAETVLHQVAADPAGAARLYGKQRHKCSRCNQGIDDETKPGYGHGYGPDCWEIIQAERKTPAP